MRFATRQAGFFSFAALGFWLAGAALSQASTITPNPPTLQSGLTYEWGVTMGQSDSASFSGSVGAKSWAEPGNPVGSKGWTHTSDWVALDLSGLSENTILTVTNSRGATGSLFPAFSIHQGWETTVSDATNHTSNNTGNVSWATSLTYLDHVQNIGGPNGTDSGSGATSVSKQFVLAPGLYSLMLGGNPSFDLGQTGSHPFLAELTTAPVPVPAALWLFGSGLAGMVGLVRRRMTV